MLIVEIYKQIQVTNGHVILIQFVLDNTTQVGFPVRTPSCPSMDEQYWLRQRVYKDAKNTFIKTFAPTKAQVIAEHKDILLALKKSCSNFIFFFLFRFFVVLLFKSIHSTFVFGRAIMIIIDCSSSPATNVFALEDGNVHTIGVIPFTYSLLCPHGPRL